MRISIFYFFLLSFCSLANAQEKLTERIFQKIYNSEYDSARILLNEHRLEIDRYYFAVLDIDNSYWENVTGTHEPDYDSFDKKLGEYTVETATNHEQKIIQLVALSYRLRFELKRYRIFDAIFTRSRTLQLYRELAAEATLPEPGQKELFELYNALIIYFDNYLKPVFISHKKENMLAAISSIEKLTQSEHIITKTMASYFLAKIYLSYEKQPENAQDLFRSLVIRYPGNPAFKDLLQECSKN